MNSDTTPIIRDVTENTGDEPDATLVPEGAASYPYVPLARSLMASSGDIPVPVEMTRIFAALCIPNEHGQSMGGHTEQTRTLAVGLADGLAIHTPRLAMPPNERRILPLCATLHDVGKTGPEPEINPEPEQFIFYYNLNFPSGESRNVMLIPDLDKAVAQGRILLYTRDYIIATLERAGYDPYKMTRRDLYNSHVDFTDRLCRRFGFDSHIAGGSAMHHSKKGLTVNGYRAREFLPISSPLETADEASAMSREGNDKSDLTIDETIRAIHEPFKEILDAEVSRAYCAAVAAATESGVLQALLTKHRRQRF